jgi:DNA (cytosine-5)-methyltransferase 1
MTHGSLFSGIGGFDLAAEWMGWENKFHCEWNPFGQKVLKYYWPEAESFNDITKTDFTKYANTIDILTGGFPCQPYSLAGKRKGKDDDRHLWPEMLRCIGEVKPRWVIGENVFGLVNWNGGLVFHEVQSDLEAQGYQVWPYVLAAASVGAPHRRDRVWFVAHNNRFGNWGKSIKQRDSYQQGRSGKTNTEVGNKGEQQFVCNITSEGTFTDTESSGFCTKMAIGKLERGQRSKFSIKRNQWHSFPSVTPLCFGNDGISDRLDGITFSKWRNESIKAGGNAIVPQVAFQIFKTIKQYETIL